MVCLLFNWGTIWLTCFTSYSSELRWTVTNKAILCLIATSAISAQISRARHWWAEKDKGTLSQNRELIFVYLCFVFHSIFVLFFLTWTSFVQCRVLSNVYSVLLFTIWFLYCDASTSCNICLNSKARVIWFTPGGMKNEDQKFQNIQHDQNVWVHSLLCCKFSTNTCCLENKNLAFLNSSWGLLQTQPALPSQETSLLWMLWCCTLGFLLIQAKYPRNQTGNKAQPLVTNLCCEMRC